MHRAEAGGDIGVGEALLWNLLAAGDVNGALNGFPPAGLGWLDIGNAAGPRNWPGVEGPGNGVDPADGGLPPPGTGVPWHSSIDWDPVLVDIALHEVHIVLGEAGPGLAAAVQVAAFGHAAAGAGAVTLTMDDDLEWFYGGVGVGAAHQTDFATVMLHEWGHILGLGHFGTAAAGYLMTGEPQPFFDGHLPGHPDTDGDGVPDVFPGAVIRTIDPDAIHGIRDLYAICSAPAPAPAPAPAFGLTDTCGPCGCPPIPEPATVCLLGTGILGLLGRHWRNRHTRDRE